METTTTSASGIDGDRIASQRRRLAGRSNTTWISASLDRAQRWLQPIWVDRRRAIGAAVGVAALWGGIAGWWTPRGPLTSSEAIWSILISLSIGVAAGLAARSRWAMLFAPIAFATVFELVRLDTSGPTVDGVAFTMYGAIAFVVGRGFHALLSLLPMVLGSALGAGVARSIESEAETDGARAGRFARRGVAVATALALVVLTAGLARPARTDPIVDAAGNRVPNSIAELTTVEINGHDLGLMIRGHSVDNPVLLFLAGGPGGSELGAMRRHLPELEEHFTVVTWDQRGSGTSYPELDPIDTITVEGYVDDTVAVTNYLRERFDRDRIYLLGQSWGTTLGVLAAQQHPELFAAYVGTGQMVSQLATDTIYYNDALAWARANGNDGLVAELEAIGPPPYEDMLGYETSLAKEHDIYPYDHSPNAEGQAQMSENLLVEEYTLIDQIHALGAFMDVFAVLYPQLQDVDFRETATEFEIPMFFVQGAHEAGGRAELFDDWYPMIDAPTKQLAIFDTSGHRPLWEQPDEFVEFMVDTVLPATGE